MKRCIKSINYAPHCIFCMRHSWSANGTDNRKQALEGTQKIENGVAIGYKAIENGVVEGFTRISDTFIKRFLVKEGGETLEDGKAKIAREEEELQGKDRERIADILQHAEEAGRVTREKANLSGK